MLNPLVRASVKQDPTRVLRPGIAIAVGTSALLAHIGIVNAPHETVAKVLVAHWMAHLMNFVFWTTAVVSAVDRYTDVVERSSEFGLLRILGASNGYLLSLLMQETVIFAIPGALCGIILALQASVVLPAVSGGLIAFAIPLLWWLPMTIVASLGSVCGALFSIRRAIADGMNYYAPCSS